MLERAQFRSNLNIGFSPLYVFVGDLAPATAADGQGFVLVVNVEFDVAAGTLAVPRVSTSFRHLYPTTSVTRRSIL